MLGVTKSTRLSTFPANNHSDRTAKGRDAPDVGTRGGSETAIEANEGVVSARELKAANGVTNNASYHHLRDRYFPQSLETPAAANRVALLWVTRELV